MLFEYIGNDRYKIYLDRVPARSIRLTADEINEIAEGCTVLIDAQEELEVVQENYDDVLDDIRYQDKLIKEEMQDALSEITDIEVRDKIEDILKAITECVEAHI